jgi:hypothetical protein
VQFGLNTLQAQAQIVALGLAQAMLLDTGRQVSFQRGDARQVFTAPFALFTVNQRQPQYFFSSLAGAHVVCDRGIAKRFRQRWQTGQFNRVFQIFGHWQYTVFVRVHGCV